MNPDMTKKLAIVGAMAGATVITRFLPFIFFPAGRKTPKYVIWLSLTLPYAAIGLLVIYCLRNLSLFSYPYGLPELLSIGVIALLHRLKGNSLLSIGGGTAVYMVLVQTVFSGTP